ncbi:hypothetical protein GCM10008905_21920 [Clostridium malenominatum]|uniref:Uncharacterized protein n=1 Tax=Clostridium malenominatum TaxID=1539 RepID=A0ABN1J1J3_9CLOT
MNKIDKNNSIVIFLKLLLFMSITTFLCSSVLSLFFGPIRQNTSGKISFVITFSLFYSLFATGHYKKHRLEIPCGENNEEMIFKIEKVMKDSHWSIIKRDEKQIVFKSSLFKTIWREYLTININEKNLEIIGYKQFLEHLKVEIGLKKKPKKIYKIIAIASLILMLFLPNIITSINRNKKYKSYDVALETAIKSRVGDENYGKVVKLLEKNAGDKSIVVLKSKLPFFKEGKITDGVCIVKITEKSGKYKYLATPFFVLDYEGELNAPYALVEGVIEMDKDTKIYYGIGKIMDSSYQLVTENKNYKEINRAEDNIFIILDNKKYEEIEFEKYLKF